MSEPVSGVKETKAALAKVSKASKAALRKGTREGAKVVQAKARELTPVRTGALERGLKVRALPRSRKWVGAMLRLGVTKGVDVFYGAFVNYGTRHIHARRFLNDAARASKARAIETARRIMAQEVPAGVKA